MEVVSKKNPLEAIIVCHNDVGGFCGNRCGG